jgi:hypothetical protein
MRYRTYLGYAISLILTIVLLELASLASFKLISGKSFEYKTLELERSERISTIAIKLENQDTSNDSEIFHPYVGYVGRPEYSYSGRLKDLNSDAEVITNNSYGMVSIKDYEYPYKKKKNDFVIAVIGGSVAAGFTKKGGEEFLQKYLDGYGFDKKIVVINLAKGGFKQPQQLFHLQYALLSGFEFDAVINIDGFNDIVFAAHNIDTGINPVFPSGYHMRMLSKMRTGQKFDPDIVNLLSDYYSYYENESSLLSLIQKPPFKYSIFLNLIGDQLTEHNLVRIRELEIKMLLGGQRSMTNEFRGPIYNWGNDKYEVSANIWKQSSEHLYAICKAYNLLYIHVLQPNQYVSGSKQLTADEKKVAYIPKHDWSVAAREGYSYLISKGRELSDKGLPFYDLTMVFNDVEESVYVDTCCHFGRNGHELVAQQIAKHMISEIDKQAVRIEE